MVLRKWEYFHSTLHRRKVAYEPASDLGTYLTGLTHTAFYIFRPAFGRYEKIAEVVNIARCMSTEVKF
jgi:hypothetical protein